MAKGRIFKGSLDELTKRVKEATKATKDDSAVTPGRRARVGNPTNIPKTKGNETIEYQRNMSPAGVKAIDRNQRTGAPEFYSGSGNPPPRVQMSAQGQRTRGVYGGLEGRIKELKKLQAKVNEGTATEPEEAAAKAMPNAIKRDMKRFGVTSDDYKSPKMATQAEKIIEAFENLKESGLAKGGMPKKKKGYMGGGMAQGKKHSYVAGGYVTDMLGKKKK
jgi:hypothetical protein